jgi:hypothetical protein
MPKEFRIPKRFEEEVEFNEEMKGGVDREKIARGIEKILEDYAGMPGNWWAVIPGHADFTEWEADPVDEDDPFLHHLSYEAGFEVYSGDPGPREFVGHVYGTGEWDETDDTVIIYSLVVSDLRELEEGEKLPRRVY